jgi:hypothetical protein
MESIISVVRLSGLQVKVLLQHTRALANGQPDTWAMFVLRLGEIVASIEQVIDPPCHRASRQTNCWTSFCAGADSSCACRGYAKYDASAASHVTISLGSIKIR